MNGMNANHKFKKKRKKEVLAQCQISSFCTRTLTSLHCDVLGGKLAESVLSVFEIAMIKIQANSTSTLADRQH